MRSVQIFLSQCRLLLLLVPTVLLLKSLGEDVIFHPEGEFDSYEVTIPEKLSFRGEVQGVVSPVSYLLQLKGKKHVLHLWPKRLLLPRHLRVFSFTEHGELLEDHPYIPKDCNYMGSVEESLDSKATISTCMGGLRGVFNIDAKHYQIEPLKASPSFEHVVYLLKKEQFGNQAENLMCWGTGYHLSMKPMGIPDLGMINDGTSCGEDRVCFNKNCVNSSVLKFDCLPEKCNTRGVCNNRKNCHCMYGWAPPFCEEVGYGGSIDSGPPGLLRGAIPLSIRVVSIIMFRLILLILSVVFVFFRQVIGNHLKPKQEKMPLSKAKTEQEESKTKTGQEESKAKTGQEESEAKTGQEESEAKTGQEESKAKTGQEESKANIESKRPKAKSVKKQKK
ncbi:disintegrin and metalloproteinase domain-containing protein 30 isoform X2 [Pongo pygmaeus]|uniref:disintegrin and metalloproteinase domain-containing protein 30 isoform X2 n=1 Tax=Pongo pygmaeus TaxID=9600 RepID=UPI0023E0DA61|nr:disintegrin and metalloproteinase domain-containing protein 30 isoform X2 [Pongo pygmaeus]